MPGEEVPTSLLKFEYNVMLNYSLVFKDLGV